jgi:hypothetical protein
MEHALACSGLAAYLHLPETGGTMDLTTSSLLTDLYQLNMVQAYLDHGETKTAVFEFFVRKPLPQRGFLVAAGGQSHDPSGRFGTYRGCAEAGTWEPVEHLTRFTYAEKAA